MKRKILFEVCCGDIESVYAAKAGGADRVELCCALGEGGLTPSYGQIRLAQRQDIPVNVLIRPRRGDFCYSDAEIEQMITDIREACRSNVNGIVIGALTPEGDIDVPTMQRLIDAAGDRQITFHRAFDMVRDPQPSLEAVIELGCHNVLTSGLMPDAWEGAENIRKLVEQAKGRINIMAGCGVTPGNATEIVRHSGVTAIHSTCSKSADSKMKYRREDVNMGNAENEYSRKTTDVCIVKKLRNILEVI